MKVELIHRLGHAGLRVIEATSFVSPKWVPQLADSADVLQQIKRHPDVRYPVLTPNMKASCCLMPLSKTPFITEPGNDTVIHCLYCGTGRWTLLIHLPSAFLDRSLLLSPL